MVWTIFISIYENSLWGWNTRTTLETTGWIRIKRLLQLFLLAIKKSKKKKKKKKENKKIYELNFMIL